MLLFTSNEINKAWQLLLDKQPDDAFRVYETRVGETAELDSNLFLGHYYLVAQNYKEAVAALLLAKQLSTQLNDNDKLLASLELLTTLYVKIADFTTAAENCLEYIDKIQSLAKSNEMLLKAFLQLGDIYQSTHNFKEAIANYFRAYNLAKTIGNSKQESDALFKIGNAYNWNEELELAEEYLLENIAINKKEGYYNAWSHASLSILYTKLKRNDDALHTFEMSLDEAKAANDKQLIANISKSLGNLHIIMGNIDKAIEVLSESIRISEELNIKTVLMLANQFIAEAHEKKGDVAKAYLHFKRYFELNEEIKHTNTDVKLKGLQLKFDVDEAKKESELYRLKNIDLVNANTEIERQKQEILTKNKEITDSIVYAKRIQNAMLPDLNLLNEVATEHFVLFKPKDIVSGDFYWLAENDDCVYFAVIDCTGHGVPGAFLSIIANNLFNKAVYEQQLSGTDEILNYVHQEIISSLNKKATDSGKDGMDVALCSIDKKRKTLTYSGAYNPICIFRKDNLTEIKADKFIIGNSLITQQHLFTPHTVDLQKNDMVYLFTDGFADQFGGPKGKKFKSKNLKKLFSQLAQYNCEVQFNKMEQIFTEWKGNLEQIDDICIMGVKI
ncbi:MAG: SpoIIE family protein phosphatase [Flavobacteriales bacterium]|nr:SpoIIE family protein phosphatase [Flavobacteriales bacterium]